VLKRRLCSIQSFLGVTFIQYPKPFITGSVVSSLLCITVDGLHNMQICWILLVLLFLCIFMQNMTDATLLFQCLSIHCYSCAGDVVGAWGGT
jgi:hypothetical protein